VHLSHIAAMALMALLISAAFGSLAQRSTAARVRQAALSFVLFMVIGIGIAWLLFPFSR
jgi:hypothetical protein